VYCKPPFGGPAQVLRYLARYTHRVAITSSRLVRLEEDRVTFTWKDYAHGEVIRDMTLPAEEFLRRFLLHVLPERFVRIRYYGLLSNRQRQGSLALYRQLLGVRRPQAAARQDWSALLRRLTGTDPERCTVCCRGRLVPARGPAAACAGLGREASAMIGVCPPASGLAPPPRAPERPAGEGVASSGVCGRMGETKPLRRETRERGDSDAKRWEGPETPLSRPCRGFRPWCRGRRLRIESP
jgi:hypothetical protein